MTEQQRLQQALQLLCTWYQKGHRDLPWRREPTPYHVWLSEIMLQQTRVQAVIPYYKRFLRALPTIEALAEAPEEQLLKLWEGLGYYSRVRNLQKAARVICEQWDGEMPQTAEQLRTLPGIGPYTAGAVASIAFGQAVPAVDGNVLRVLTRLQAQDWDIKDTKTKRVMEQQLVQGMPHDCPGDCNQALMELGAMICLPNGVPLCEQCPLKELCLAKQQEKQLKLPRKTPKKPRPVENRVVCLIRKDGHIALRKRPKKGLLAELWEFPNFLDGEQPETALGISLNHVKPLPAAKHVFTHLEWYMTGISADTTEDGYFTWVTPEQLEQDIALPSAFRAYRKIALQDE